MIAEILTPADQSALDESALADYVIQDQMVMEAMEVPRPPRLVGDTRPTDWEHLVGAIETRVAEIASWSETLAAISVEGLGDEDRDEALAAAFHRSPIALGAHWYAAIDALADEIDADVYDGLDPDSYAAEAASDRSGALRVRLSQAQDALIQGWLHPWQVDDAAIEAFTAG